MKKLLPFIILGLLAILAVLVEVYLPKPLNWHETFEKKDKNPYGSFILVDFLKDIFPNRKITITEKTPYQVLDYYDYSEETFRYQLDSIATAPANGSSEKQYATSPDSIISQDSLNRNNDSIAKTNLANMEEDLQNSRIIPDIQRPKDSVVLEKENYVFINSEFSPGETDAHALLNFAKTGNSVFIAAQEMQGVLADSLKIKIGNGLYDMNFSTNDLAIDQKKDSIYLTLLNTKLKTFEKKYYYRNGTVPGYFSSIDTANTQVLGLNSDGKATFICIKYGEGFFFISSTPLAYTNYNMMLADNSEYISASLSYLPVQDTFWDEYYKNYREANGNVLRFVESQPPLHWAFNLALGTVFLFVLFEAKRRQRIIPIINPPQNTTVKFISTIGRLYFQKGNHKDIAAKKIYYFLEYIRTNFYLHTNLINQEFIDKVAGRSGVDAAKVGQLFALIQYVQKSKSISQSDLHELVKRMEWFKKESNV